MSLTVQLLGRPAIHGAPGGGYHMRSRKSWALLAYLLLAERPPTRAQMAGLLFDQAHDPLGALRWSLAEVRRALGAQARIEGDPIVLTLPPGTTVDVDVLMRRPWSDAVALPSLGGQLLEGAPAREAGAFDSWLLSEQFRLAAATEQILHEAALGSLSRGALDDAIGYAVRLLAMTPLDENHHALLIRLYRMAGRDEAAERQYGACVEMLNHELGMPPSPLVRAALREPHLDHSGAADPAAVRAALESGRAAVSAGAIQTGADSLRAATRLADRAGDPVLQVAAHLELAETLIHSLRGFDEEGIAALQAADDLATAHHDRPAVAEARAELGYVEFLRGRYDRARIRLTEAVHYGAESPSVSAKATIYLGCVSSDQGEYAMALGLLDGGVQLSREVGDARRTAYGLAMIGRAHLLRRDLDSAADRLDEALALASHDHWLSFLPWPQALRGEVLLARGEVSEAAEYLEQAFARACRLGDPCWEGVAARGLALVADASGDPMTAFRILQDARRRADRLADPYVWLDGYILDAQCTLGRRQSHVDTARWVAALRQLASRSGMRELHVRALLHGAALGYPGNAAAARLLAADVDNRQLQRLVAEA